MRTGYRDVNGIEIRDGDILEISGDEYVIIELGGKWYLTRDIDYVEELDLKGLKELRPKVIGNIMTDFYGVVTRYIKKDDSW